MSKLALFKKEITFRIMEYLKRIKDSVSNVLPVGNPIFNEYEISKHRASAGPGLMWKVFDATNKSTKQVKLNICVTFIFLVSVVYHC